MFQFSCLQFRVLNTIPHYTFGSVSFLAYDILGHRFCYRTRGGGVRRLGKEDWGKGGRGEELRMIYHAHHGRASKVKIAFFFLRFQVGEGSDLGFILGVGAVANDYIL